MSKLEKVEFGDDGILFTPDAEGVKFPSLAVECRFAAGGLASVVVRSNGTPEGDAEMLVLVSEMAEHGYKITDEH